MSEFNRRELLVKGTSAAAAAAAAAYALRGPVNALLPGSARAATAAQATPSWNHDPASAIGPEHWAELDPAFSVCGTGTSQSPVDIETANVSVVRSAPLLLRYHRSELAVENTGHVVEVVIPSDVEDVLRIGGDRYTLTQYHFHTVSEHTVNGRHAAVEGHFVHTNDAGDTAVVGVLYRIGPRPNRLLDKILLAAPDTSGEEGHALGEANPASLFKGVRGVSVQRGRVRVPSFYAYGGSLTTPGCTEDVRWSVLSRGGQVSQEAVSHFHHVVGEFANYNGYPNNNRPVQPLNGRVVQLRRAARHRH